MKALKVTLLGRPGCHLCEEYEQDLSTHFGRGFFEIVHADVDSRPEWQRRYGLKIPVLLDSQGQLIGQAPFDGTAICELLPTES